MLYMVSTARHSGQEPSLAHFPTSNHKGGVARSIVGHNCRSAVFPNGGQMQAGFDAPAIGRTGSAIAVAGVVRA